MDNTAYRNYIERIDKIKTIDALNAELEHIEESINDPFDDGTDLAGDLALTHISLYIRSKIQELSKKGNEEN